MNRRDALKNTLLAMGYTITVPSLISIFNSCSSNTSSSFKPLFLSADQAAVIAELAETILPKTQTPGAKELNIDRFIDKMLHQVFSPEKQQLFVTGLNDFEKKSKELNGKTFIDSSPEQRTKLLTKLEQETEKTPPSVWGINLKKDAGPLPFYRQAKSLVLLGYFTSQEIGKKVLVYDPVPGPFKADVPVTPSTKISFE
jgi:Gluconate 2-dehydrogenase subunit 3